MREATLAPCVDGGVALFNKTPDEDKRPVASPPRIGEAQPVRSRNVSVIGPTLAFRGGDDAPRRIVAIVLSGIQSAQSMYV